MSTADVERRTRALEAADWAMSTESRAVAFTPEAVRETLPDAIDLLRRGAGRVHFSGLSKSGHTDSRTAVTRASTGLPSIFMCTAEALLIAMTGRLASMVTSHATANLSIEEERETDPAASKVWSGFAPCVLVLRHPGRSLGSQLQVAHQVVV